MSVHSSVSKWLRGRCRPAPAVRKPARLGLEPLDEPGMDVPYVPIGMLPVGERDGPLAGSNTHDTEDGY